ncbi:hypothetical protein SAMN05444397_104328 [Flavobacterium aquidurense]|uniref:Uncharacterized protein n=1 Tax=Flavobacterium frigidimaris TaxID=262320 RepID=A0ABX4BMS5_FLAFR|nr:hypothetical protein B0A65_17230 [Flavobacterium frigidimaris]SDZ24780.1 hypothetical protein SAMN05444397_104328 [Flavobacterium aquidurense]
MNIDILLYLIFIIPLFIVVFQIEKLNTKKIFIIWISIAIFLIITGILIENNSNNEMRYLSYFGSQMLFIFLILQKTTRNIYFKLFRREPEFGKFPRHKIDNIYTLFISIGTIALPFLIDAFIFKKFN